MLWLVLGASAEERREAPDLHRLARRLRSMLETISTGELERLIDRVAAAANELEGLGQMLERLRQLKERLGV